MEATLLEFMSNMIKVPEDKFMGFKDQRFEKFLVKTLSYEDHQLKYSAIKLWIVVAQNSSYNDKLRLIKKLDLIKLCAENFAKYLETSDAKQN